ncbi:MAG: MucR family transcriptional regulator [Desulfovibrio sp.]|nr:MucR family transcriptional regulator [Desulfovibrio sp.]
MPIDENMLFKTIYERHGDKPIEFVMQEVAKAKASYLKAEIDLHNLSNDPTPTPNETVETEAIPLPEMELTKKKRYTKRSLQGRDPQQAIQDDTIMCCLCGETKTSISSAHLKSVHGITPDEYRKLCGYAPNQQLACKQLQLKRAEAIQKAQAGRGKKNKKTMAKVDE